MSLLGVTTSALYPDTVGYGNITTESITFSCVSRPTLCGDCDDVTAASVSLEYQLTHVPSCILWFSVTFIVIIDSVAITSRSLSYYVTAGINLLGVSTTSCTLILWVTVTSKESITFSCVSRPALCGDCDNVTAASVSLEHQLTHVP
ncbi:hypothetical protein J6590_062161 [Homalodisca vitripennis]|nr:hypothetical protein J6590_062161 [Homalodisca vitripennis]